MSLESESILAVTGVIRPKPDAATIGAGAELVEQFRRRAGRWVTSSEVKTWSPPPSQGAAKPEAIRERLIHTPAEPEGVHDIGDDVLAAEWVSELTDAREQLLAAWPAVSMRGGIETEEVPLSFDRAQDWLGLLAVVEDPFRLLLELESGAVLPAQLALFEAIYPALHGVLVEEVFRAVVELQTKKRDLRPVKDRVVRMVLGTEPDAPIIVPQAEEPPPEKPKKSDLSDTRTVAQKSGT